VHNLDNVFRHLGKEVVRVILVEIVATERVCEGACIKKL